VLIGLLGGRLGVGGGVVAVPMLIEVFDLIGVAKAPWRWPSARPRRRAGARCLPCWLGTLP
jgi:hypothetical protein